MNKKTKALALLMGLAVASYGDVKMTWVASGGFFFSATPEVGILGDATGNSTFAQLIYSVDLYADVAGVGGVATGDDVVWDTANILEDGVANDSEFYDSYALFDDYYSRTFASGYVYARIFQDNNIGVGDWYFYTPMLALQDITGINPSQSLQMNADTTYGDAIDSGSTVAQVVPEPAAIGLIGLGGVITLTASRIRRRNNR
jgi:hypothetical protein